MGVTSTSILIINFACKDYNCLISVSRHLELHYPHFPTEQDLMKSVQSCRRRDDNFAVLIHFSLQWQRLQAGGEILQDLVEFYQWLHNELACLISKKKAFEVKIMTVVNKLASKHNKKMKGHFHDLFKRCKGEKWHDYIL